MFWDIARIKVSVQKKKNKKNVANNLKEAKFAQEDSWRTSTNTGSILHTQVETDCVKNQQAALCRARAKDWILVPCFTEGAVWKEPWSCSKAFVLLCKCCLQNQTAVFSNNFSVAKTEYGKLLKWSLYENTK